MEEHVWELQPAKTHGKSDYLERKGKRNECSYHGGEEKFIKIYWMR